ncbi:uncharacterized protein LOC110038083 [Phalaenopsis equestris]|uniref:uncharacterized protein LOC110038083 n=1 Tax=Phalaenopsis equestris TaxID=78828 RepID=UPI0009E5CD6D|nr:uncharacterized protein LOC110038083 [Phalaenopsis equestris]
MDGRNLLIKLSNEEDYARVFAKQSLLIAGTPMKLMKGTSGFDPSKKPPIVPIWFKLPNLPIQYYNQNVLFNIVRTLDFPLKVDAPTYNLARPVGARILIERDITLPDVKRVWISTEDEGFCQSIVVEHKALWWNIVVEQRPLYCPHCRMFGHTLENFYRLIPPSKKAVGPPKGATTQGGTSSVLDNELRRNVGETSIPITRSVEREVQPNMLNNSLGEGIDQGTKSIPTSIDNLMLGERQMGADCTEER